MKQPSRVADKQCGNSAYIEQYQFKPGKSGNPNGRPKREMPSETLRLMLNAEYGVEAVKQLERPRDHDVDAFAQSDAGDRRQRAARSL